MKYNEMKAIVDFLEQSEGADSETWQKAIGNLKTLMAELKPYEDPGENEPYPTISQKDYERIEKKFDETVKSTNDFLKENQNNNNIADDVRIKLSQNLNKEFLSKAYIEFKNVRPNKNMSLHESMENFRYENVELSSNELNRVAGNMSNRIQMTVNIEGKDVKGVFTKSEIYDPQKQYNSLVDEMKLKYAKYDSFWNSLKNEEFRNNGIESVDPNLFMNRSSGEVYDSTPEARANAMDNAYQLIALDEYPAVRDEFNKYRNDPDFFSAMLDFSTKAEKYNIARGVNEDMLGIEPGQNIDSRNSAMSSVANLIGANDLIARSKNIAVKMPDGTFQNGTFMEFVNSKDITKLDSIDEMRVYGLDAYESKEVKEQLSNLQVLDYVCGNIDRHPGNILYKFDPKTHKLANIKGIDNDASFFKSSLGKNENMSNLPSIKRMRVIDEKMAQKILNVDEGMLSATLHGYGLSEAEIHASWERLQNLQQAIKEGHTFDPEKGLEPHNDNSNEYGLTIVKSEDWDKLTLNDLKVENNYYHKLISAQKMITTNEMVTFNMKQNAEASKRSVKAMLNQGNTKALLDRARSHKPFMGVSNRYQNVLTAFQNYQNTPVPDDPLSEAGQAKWASAEALKRAVDAYKQEKKDIGHFDSKGNMARVFKGNALYRIEDVNEIGQFVDKLFESKKLANDSQNTLDNAMQKQRELDEFKNKSPQEQQNILDQKSVEEEAKNRDLAVRIKQSLADEELFDLSDEYIADDMSVQIDDNHMDMNNN